VTASAAARNGSRRGLVEKALLAVEILGAYRDVRRRLRQQELPAALAGLRAAAREPHSSAAPDDLALGRAVRRTLALVPGDSRCLVQSLVLTRLLARRGVTTRVVIGVTGSGEAFGAHAWVEHDGRPLLPVRGSAGARLVEL
jgi:transglutaminase superfamily protein